MREKEGSKNYFERGFEHQERFEEFGDTRDCQEALWNYGKALEGDLKGGEIYEVYRSRSMLWIHLGDFGRAIQDYSEAIQRTEDVDELINLYSLRGESHLELQEYGRAIEDYNEAIKREAGEQSEYDYRNRGIAYLGLKRYSEGVEDFKTAIEEMIEFELQEYDFENIDEFNKHIGKCTKEWIEDLEFQIKRYLGLESLDTGIMAKHSEGF